MDTYSKILLALGNINFLSHIVEDIRSTNSASDSKILQARADENKQKLEEVLHQLTETAESLVDFCNGCDCISSEDASVLNPAFRVLLVDEI